MAIPTVPFGTHGLRTSRLGFGCMSLTPTFYASDIKEDDAVAVIQHAYAKGIRLFNTSDLYGPYTNEQILGKAIKDVREDVLISTKWGPMQEGGIWTFDFSPENARRCCEGARQRLGVEFIDLFTLRGPLDDSFPIADTMQTMKVLLEEGKIKGVGLSEIGPRLVRRAHAVVPITALELEWSLFTRDVEDDLIPLCRELGIAIMAYSPLGRGMLTGALKSADQLDDKDWRKFASPRFQGENLDKNLQLVANVEAMAKTKGCTPGQLALAWLLAKGNDVFPIPGTKQTKYLDENVGALAVSLSASEVEELERLVPHDQVAGTRYPNMEHTTYHTNPSGH